MICSKCKHQGKFKGRDWANTPCSKCRLGDRESHAKVYSEEINGEEEPREDVYFDPKSEGEPSYDEHPWGPQVAEEDDPLIPLSVLGTAMALWMSLTSGVRKMIQLRMCGKKLDQIATHLGCTRQAVDIAIKRALEKRPELSALITKNVPKKRLRRNP